MEEAAAKHAEQTKLAEEVRLQRDARVVELGTVRAGLFKEEAARKEAEATISKLKTAHAEEVEALKEALELEQGKRQQLQEANSAHTITIRHQRIATKALGILHLMRQAQLRRAVRDSALAHTENVRTLERLPAENEALLVQLSLITTELREQQQSSAVLVAQNRKIVAQLREAEAKVEEARLAEEPRAQEVARCRHHLYTPRRAPACTRQ